MLEKVLRMALLYDFYGALLTDKQKECVELHYFSDYSLSEIADTLSVSRQAVHDNLRRAEQVMEDYEAELQLTVRHNEEREVLAQIRDLLRSSASLHCDTNVQNALGIVETLVNEEYKK